MSTASAAAIANRPDESTRRRRSERLGVEERRRQLLDLGVRIVATRRYEESWLEEVADSAQISKGLIYHYFGTKRGFYVAILRHIAQDLARSWADNVTPLIEQGATADAVNRAGLDAYLDYAQAFPAAFRTLIEAGAGIDPEVKRVEGYLREQLIRHVAHYRGLEDLPELARTGIKGWAAFAEQVTLDWLEGERNDREAVVAMLLAVMGAMLSKSL